MSLDLSSLNVGNRSASLANKLPKIRSYANFFDIDFDSAVLPSELNVYEDRAASS